MRGDRLGGSGTLALPLSPTLSADGVVVVAGAVLPADVTAIVVLHTIAVLPAITVLPADTVQNADVVLTADAVAVGRVLVLPRSDDSLGLGEGDVPYVPWPSWPCWLHLFLIF